LLAEEAAWTAPRLLIVPDLAAGEHDGDNEPGSEEYLGIFAEFPLESSHPLPLLKPASSTIHPLVLFLKEM
jgi:hypothetical protein